MFQRSVGTSTFGSTRVGGPRENPPSTPSSAWVGPDDACMLRHGVVPPMTGYPSLQRLPISIGERELNIVAFAPRTARELLISEGVADLRLSIIIPMEAPYLRGLKPNPFGAPRFKFAWIDTHWRPS